jgi:hypothetical protein
MILHNKVLIEIGILLKKINMHIIPVTILDNFLDNPDMMRKLALDLPYHKDPEGKWPGLRSDPLHTIDNDVFDLFTKKYFSLFFDIESIAWSVDARFQKIGKEYGRGWAHTDVGPIITGIIYLDPQPVPNSGTIILEKTSLRSNGRLNYRQEDKVNFYQGKLLEEEAELARQRNNDSFSSGITVQSKYNRLLTFDSHLVHTADEFYGDPNFERLTLTFFVFDVSTTKTPIYKSKQHIL